MYRIIQNLLTTLTLLRHEFPYAVCSLIVAYCFLQDLEQYATSYSGLMRIERLQFIAEHCPQLRVEALKMALTFVQRTFNVDTYEEIHRKLTEATRLE